MHALNIQIKLRHFLTVGILNIKANTSFIPNNNLTSVSSDPKRLCNCDSNGYPQCAKLLKIFAHISAVYSGEPFNLSLVVVGHDFGVNTGPLKANFKSQSRHSRLKQYNHWLQSTQCSNVSYSIISTNEYEQLYLTRSILIN